MGFAEVSLFCVAGLCRTGGLSRNTLTLLTAGLPPSLCPSRRCPFSATIANTMPIKSEDYFLRQSPRRGSDSLPTVGRRLAARRRHSRLLAARALACRLGLYLASLGMTLAPLAPPII
jgi:hypothetical protein